MSAVKFTETHEWIRVEASGYATIGITHFAQEQLGDIVYVQLPAVGERFERGDEVALIESVKAAGEIKLPLTGTILEVNPLLDAEPAVVNVEPQDKGWFFRIRLENAEELNTLLEEADYQRLITI